MAGATKAGLAEQLRTLQKSLAREKAKSKRLEKYRAEARLVTQRHDLAMRGINEGVYDWDIVKGSIYYSERVQAATGMTPEANRSPQDWRGRIHPDDLAEYDRRLVEHFKGRSDRFECDYRFRALDDSWRWARQHGIAIRDARGRAVRMVGSTGDITALKRIEQALRESQERLILATQAATEGIYEWNLANGSLQLSGRARDFFAVRDDALTPTTWNKRIHREDFEGYRDAMRAYFRGRQPAFEHEYRIRNTAGGWSWIADRGVAVRDGAGRVTRLVGALSDITQRKRREEELRRAHDEATAALERQTATAEILKVIASSPSGVQPVFDAILDSACLLCDSQLAAVFRYDGTLMHLAATRNWPAAALAKAATRWPAPPDSHITSGRVILTGDVVCQEDTLADSSYDQSAAHAAGWRRMLGVPMLREGVTIGAIVVTWREPGPIEERQISLLKTFAHQAVIAIENVRLFNETRESLEQQTAISEILRVISDSPSDVQPVLDAVAERAARICAAQIADIVLADGRTMRVAASIGNLGRPGGSEPLPLDRNSVMGRAIVDKTVVHVADLQNAPDGEFPLGRTLARKYGHRAILAVPLLREGRALGTILLRRAEVRPFDDKHIALLKTFANQAAIAIENVRLFNDTREALERQTATAEILKVISSSPTDVQPVFDTILENAVRLCDSPRAAVFRYDGQRVHLAATRNWTTEALAKAAAEYPRPADPHQMNGRILSTGKVVHIEDALTDPSYDHGRALAMGWRQLLGVPMLREGAVIGAITFAWTEAGRVPERQVELLKTFADQAVIAIENVRLFTELKSRTEELTKSVGQLTALGEVSRAVSSTLDVETVLDTIVSRACQLAGADGCSIYEYDEDANWFELRASYNFDAHYEESLRGMPLRKGEGLMGRAAEAREPMQIPDITAPGAYESSVRDILVRFGYRALLSVPLLREGQIIGSLSLTRKVPGAFSAEVIELLKTFATQSALAIQNARLFREIAEKGRQLEVASRHKSDFLASMSHELRTPLNAILGFNEMILGEIYGDVPADMKEPLTDIQTSGKHLLRLINNVLDLAKIEAGRMELAPSEYVVNDIVETVRSSLRPLAADKGLELVAAVAEDIPLAYGDAGRITQCLMNLAGNSLKFTKAGKVEIAVELRGELLAYRVSDTGIGMAPDKIGNLFSEFKQADATIAGEYGGTGLGLSISKKFVEMHGGRIWVESKLGQGSHFLFEIPLRLSAGTPS